MGSNSCIKMSESGTDNFDIKKPTKADKPLNKKTKSN